MKFNNHTYSILAGASFLSLSQSLIGANAGYAQGTMSDRAMERSHFYSAPREYQIVDERPVVRDFREAPTNGGQIGIPNGPGGGQGAGGLGGIGGGSGANPVLPSGGLPIQGGNAPAYKNASSGLGSLPKSGFGGTNIPAGGMGPRGILPGVTTGVVGNIMNQNKHVKVAVPMHAAPVKGPAASTHASGPPPVTSYGSYHNTPTTYGNSSRTEQNLRGRLLRAK